MKKFIRISLVAMLVLAIADFAFAAGGTLQKFVVTLDKIYISRNAGRTWLEIHSGSKQFNLKALSGGSPTQFSSVKIPAGTYNKWKVHCIYYDVEVLNDDTYGNVSNDASCDVWDTGTCNVKIDAGGSTSATWTFDAETSYEVVGPSAISLDPQITVQ